MRFLHKSLQSSDNLLIFAKCIIFQQTMAKGIKRILVLSMMAMIASTACVGQNVYEGSTPLTVINQEWGQTTLGGAFDGSLIGMLDCFNKKWPTWMVEHAIKTMKKGQRLERYGEGLPTVFYDSKNGWVDVAASPMGTEFMKVCYWRRSNGHRLLGIYFGKPVDPTIHFVCFYDYNPQNKTLTPEPHIIDGYHSTADTKFYYELPQQGKDFIILEYGPKGDFRHLFKWDGMKPVYSTTEKMEEYADGEHCDEDEE